MNSVCDITKSIRDMCIAYQVKNSNYTYREFRIK